MSKNYNLPIVDGTTTHATNTSEQKDHSISFNVQTSGTATGTITVQGRFPAASYYTEITDAVAIPLSAPYSFQFGGPVDSYEVTIAGISNVTSLIMNDK